MWTLLLAAQIIALTALAAAGGTTTATPVLRYTGLACVAGIFLCMPPLLLKLFVAAQLRIGNGALPLLQSIRQHEMGITLAVWTMIVVALALAFPRIKADLAGTSGVSIQTADRASVSAANETSPTAPPTTPVTPPTAIDSTRAFTPRASLNADSTDVTTPGAGSATRTAILDALRTRLKTAGRFRVDHIRMWQQWAFVRATEVVELDKGELQETDLTVAALLELPNGSTTGWWRVAELWTVPDEHVHPLADFLRSIRTRQQRDGLPSALLPEDLR